jgi:hypothetical protein
MRCIETIGDDYTPYAEFWNAGIDRIEAIQKQLDLEMRRLESQHPDYEKSCGRIKVLAHVLSSIYSGVNVLQGRDDVLALKAMIETCARRYSRQNADFALIGSLLEKIADQRNRSLENFPSLVHHDVVLQEGRRRVRPSEENWPFRWITFQRGWSWFILPFDELALYDFTSISDWRFTAEGIAASINGEEMVFFDLLSRARTRQEPLRYLVSADGGRRFAATSMGRTIYARRDFISGMVKPFSAGTPYALSPGRVQMFGHNHILIRTTADTRAQ